MPRAAVLGSPISHSLSPVLHNAGYAARGMSARDEQSIASNGITAKAAKTADAAETWEYVAFDVPAGELAGFVYAADSDFVGFSVTMPGKFEALELADVASERARLVGSANTLVRRDGGWLADNTDTEGALGALRTLFAGRTRRAADCDGLTETCTEKLAEPLPALPTLRTAVVIGAGGSARPIIWALAQCGVEEITVINRSDRLAEMAPLADALQVTLTHVGFDADLLALTLAADVVVSTVPSAVLEPYLQDLANAPVYDVIYETLPTPLMIHAAANGHAVVGGEVMLAHQAFAQFELFTGQPAPREAMVEALKEALAQR